MRSMALSSRAAVVVDGGGADGGAASDAVGGTAGLDAAAADALGTRTTTGVDCAVTGVGGCEEGLVSVIVPRRWRWWASGGASFSTRETNCATAIES